MTPLIATRRLPSRVPGVPVLKLRGLTVAVVVPQEAFAETLAASFREGGHVPVVVPDLAAAAADPQFAAADVVVLALDAPHDAGLAVARHIQESAAWRKPFVVAITGRGDPEVHAKARAVGVHLYLEKPVDLDRLRGLLVRFHGLLADVEGFDPVI